MASYGLCFAHSNQSLFTQNQRPLSSPRPRTRSPLFTTLISHSSSSYCGGGGGGGDGSSSSSSCLQKPKPDNKNHPIEEELPIRFRKRIMNLSILMVILSAPLSESMAEEELELERYTDSREGFTLLRPSSWIKVDKAGATTLFEDPSKGANNVGVVVTPVRLTNLSEFGNPQFVADKLIQAEKRKESTKDAEVISALERSGQGGLQVYEFEYKVDSTRGGLKRIFSAAFVASKKLYLLNIGQSEKHEHPLETQRRIMLEQVLHSFDVAHLA